MGEAQGVNTTLEACTTYGSSVADRPTLPDSADALAYLKEHFKLVILSNLHNATFRELNKNLGVVFDAIYTAEDVGSYKPSARNFDHILEKIGDIGISKGAILHTAESLFHDHVPVNRAGPASAWMHRRHTDVGFGATMDPGEQPHTEFRFTSIAAMADAHPFPFLDFLDF